MANADRFPEAAAASVAGQLAAFFPPAPAPAAAAPPRELAETLAVCLLEARQVRRPPRDLALLARPSGVWHHQIRTAGKPTHVARSRQSGFERGGAEVRHLAESPIAAKIDRALAWADRHVKGPATVRLLVAPAYYLHALLVVRGEACSAVLADQPAGYSQLAYRREYPLAEFLNRLSRERPSQNLTP